MVDCESLRHDAIDNAVTILIEPIRVADAEAFHACLDAVSRERLYLALLEAPSLDDVRAFVAQNVERGVPQVVARDGDVVVGWCDIVPGWHHTLRHCGSVGMGLLPAYRGQRIGEALLSRCLMLATAAGITRVELEVRLDNARAVALYTRLAFRREGVKVRGMRVDGQYIDTLAMSLIV